jgi:hypothetical protein
MKHYIISEAEFRNLPTHLVWRLMEMPELKRLTDAELSEILNAIPQSVRTTPQGFKAFTDALQDKLGVPK